MEASERNKDRQDGRGRSLYHAARVLGGTLALSNAMTQQENSDGQSYNTPKEGRSDWQVGERAKEDDYSFSGGIAVHEPAPYSQLSSALFISGMVVATFLLTWFSICATCVGLKHQGLGYQPYFSPGSDTIPDNRCLGSFCQTTTAGKATQGTGACNGFCIRWCDPNAPDHVKKNFNCFGCSKGNAKTPPSQTGTTTITVYQDDETKNLGQWENYGSSGTFLGIKNAHMDIIDRLKAKMNRKDPKKTARFDPMAAAGEAFNQKVILAYHCGILKKAPDAIDFPGDLPASQVLDEMNDELSDKISKLSVDERKKFNEAEAALGSDAKFFETHKADPRVIQYHSLSGTLCDLFNSVMLTTTSTSPPAQGVQSAFEQDRHEAFFANVLQTKRNELLYTLTSKNVHSLVSAVSTIEDVADADLGQFSETQRLLSTDDLSKLLGELLESIMEVDDKIAELIPRDKFDLMYPPRDKAIEQVTQLKAVTPEDTTAFLTKTQADANLVRWATGRNFTICTQLDTDGKPDMSVNAHVYTGTTEVKAFGKMSYCAQEILTNPNFDMVDEQAKGYYQWMKSVYQSQPADDNNHFNQDLDTWLTIGQPLDPALQTLLQEQEKDIKHDERVTKAFDEMINAVDSFQLHLKGVEKYCLRASTLELAPQLTFTDAAAVAASKTLVEELALKKVVELTGKIQGPASKLLKWLESFEAPRQEVCNKITDDFEPAKMQNGGFYNHMATTLFAMRGSNAYFMDDKLSTAKKVNGAVGAQVTWSPDADGVIANAIVGHVAHGMAAICRTYPDLFFTEPELAPVIGMQLMLHALSMKVQESRKLNGHESLDGIGVWKFLPGSEKYITDPSYYEIENQLPNMGNWVHASGYGDNCDNRDYFSPICENPFGDPHPVSWGGGGGSVFHKFPHTHTKAFVGIERHTAQYELEESARLPLNYQNNGYIWYNQAYSTTFMHKQKPQAMTSDQEYTQADFEFIDQHCLPFPKHLMTRNGTN